MGRRSSPEELDAQILDAMTALIQQMIACAEKVAESLSVPGFCAKALHMLDSSMAMKELGRKLHCDPSFVTVIADTLEKRGLARREPGASDRRVKNLVLSPEGLELKRRLEGEMIAGLPWSHVLDTDERRCLLGLLLKMTQAGTPDGADCTGEVTAAESFSPAASSGLAGQRRRRPASG